ncbi:Glutamate 5-kinase / RNA-binding C-terminal domain PUA [Candidatus Phaeomarinobacter ectocarpi]|uniref:Glutamate 5-kinase n=1 Tax=Candidatus Phaeomarinibacter ectocarpi TaxID=1458461 RepID=X5MEU1_9HYPH|nr:glutamate 5-kinase [Candidatus Phaeomarinobacter ectocarpi]CDO59444.1 Glutamate 5-kinase / RNA-binding C-terminal domain PUA [Candidatus Phaeomarinobacter ectocarpi]
MSDRLVTAKRVVIKIGSALLVDAASGRMRGDWLQTLGDDVARLRARGQQVIIVSSGAIALGSKALGLGARNTLALEESQAAAAFGQIGLARAYQEALDTHDIRIAQVLLTLGDTEGRRSYLNARSTLTKLLDFNLVPVVNENDTVATTEIRYGDNDRLSARVASMVDADCLVLLSDVDGLYTDDPVHNPDATLIREVDAITPQIEAMAGTAGTDMSTGGMITKLEAARIATEAGVHMVIAKGATDHPLKSIEEGANATWFTAHETPVVARKRWISGSLQPSGVIAVDDGAAAALARGRSLLPAGVCKVSGTFDRGDAVIVQTKAGVELGRGLVAYASSDASRIAGHKSGEIEALLGYRGRDEMIHRDHLALNRAAKDTPKTTSMTNTRSELSK